MLKNQLNALNNDINQRERSSLIHKLLPFLLILSFAWVGLFGSYSYTSFEIADYFRFGMAENFGEFFFMDILFEALIAWFWFEISFYVFKILIGFSVFSYTIPSDLMKNKARLFMVIRNCILGIFTNLMFFVPQFVGVFLIVIELFVDILVFIWFAFAVMRETVDTMIKPNVFKVLATSFFILRALSVISLVLGVL